ncbi:MAG: EAL domain-containing protein [Ruminiclostridium sp.]|nr:EAL domain-containing protein [Ruminiclostridium sp.]
MEKKIDKIKDSLIAAEHLFVGIFAFVAITAAILMLIYVPAVSKFVNVYAGDYVLSATEGNANMTEAYFKQNMMIMKTAASEFSEANLSDPDEVMRLCVRIADSSDFKHIGFTNTDGITISSFGGMLNTSDRIFVREGLAGEHSVYSRLTCDFDGQLMDAFSVPVINKRGEVVGVLTGHKHPLELSSLKLVDIAGRTDCNFILDDYGSVLYSSGPNEIGLREGGNIFDVISSESPYGKEINYILNSVHNIELKEYAIRGTEYFEAFVPLKGGDWTFVSIIPRAHVMGSFNLLIIFSVGAVGVMALLLIVCSMMLAMRMRRISEEISEAVDTSLRQMYVDPLTGHDTVRRFRENYAAAMKDTATGHALISLDVDRFKAVNDLLGFEGGNEIIRKLSDNIKRNIGGNDFFVRSVGDQFYIFANYSENDELVSLAERIISDAEYITDEIKLSMSIGIYKIDDPMIKSRVAADRADMARDSIKGRKESRYIFFDSSMLKKIRREKRIEDIMEDALALGEFIVYLQPKFGLGAENVVVGAEALVRWRHEGRLIPPGEFIPLFEKNGFVNKIDYYMFEEVCKLQKKYVTMGYDPKVISVNMSRTHIHHTGFVDELAAICEKYGIDTKYFEIEITESAAYEDMEILRDIFREIKSKGFHVSIDDFGTGYSSLNMLKDLPVDVLKIDRSFLTENADEHESASVIIGCVVSLAASLRIRTICEGIETKEQAVLLTKLGCNMAQGFFFARPMPVSDYEQLTYGIQG